MFEISQGKGFGLMKSIRYAKTIEDLWFARPTLLQQLAKTVGEEEANRELKKLKPLFLLSGLGVAPDYRPRH